MPLRQSPVLLSRIMASARLSAVGFVAYSLAFFVGLPQLFDDRLSLHRGSYAKHLSVNRLLEPASRI